MLVVRKPPKTGFLSSRPIQVYSKMTPAKNCLITTWHNLKTRFTKKANYEVIWRLNLKTRFTKVAKYKANIKGQCQ